MDNEVLITYKHLSKFRTNYLETKISHEDNFPYEDQLSNLKHYSIAYLLSTKFSTKQTEKLDSI